MKRKFSNHVSVESRQVTYASKNAAVKVVIGIPPHAKIYLVDGKLLYENSEFFRNELNGLFIATSVRHVKLKNSEKAAVEIYLHWLYHREIATIRTDGAIGAEQESLLEALILEEKIKDSDFSDAVFDAMLDTVTAGNNPAFDILVWRLESMSNRALEKLLVDTIAFDEHPDQMYAKFGELIDLGPNTSDGAHVHLYQETVQNALKTLSEKNSQSRPIWNTDYCALYHKHATGEGTALCYREEYGVSKKSKASEQS